MKGGISVTVQKIQYCQYISGFSQAEHIGWFSFLAPQALLTFLSFPNPFVLDLSASQAFKQR